MSAETLRKAIADGVERIELTAGAATFELLRIRPGQFMMGSPPSDSDAGPNEKPAIDVTISRPFYLGIYEVTQQQYAAVMGSNPSSRTGEQLPVHELATESALAFCRKLSEMTSLNVTLPTEAQWEYACRAGSETRYASGDTPTDLARVGWYRDNANEQLHPVGRKEPNAWGLYDMHGNVAEICLDLIPSYEGISAVDPMGPLDPNRSAMRGGGFMHDAAFCRSAARMVSTPRFGGAGIRIVVNP